MFGWIKRFFGPRASVRQVNDAFRAKMRECTERADVAPARSVPDARFVFPAFVPVLILDCDCGRRKVKR